MRFVVNVFFRQIDILHYNNFPAKGPVILVGNHANQFVDGFNLVASCKRPVRMLIAQKSYDRPIIGDVAKLMGSVPVLRPQDRPMKGLGKIVSIVDNGADGLTIKGENTKWTSDYKLFGCGKIIKGCKIKAKWSNGSKIELSVKDAPTDPNSLTVLPTSEPITVDSPIEYKVLPKIDQKVVFQKVIDHLDNGACIGIFPEGGSHDQGHLLPLKAGVTIMALEAAKQNIPVQICCAGLTYFHAHRFRSKALVQFGKPFECPQELVELHKTDPRAACNKLLERITVELRMVTTNTTDYRTKKIVQTIRRLYQPNSVKFLTGEEHMMLNKKFVVGFDRIREQPPSQLLMEKVGVYIDEIKAAGWKDKELKLAILIESVHSNVCLRLGYVTFHALQIIAFMPIVLPSFIINAPIMAICKWQGLRHQKTALAASTVKVGAFDVIASEMVKVAVVITPIFYIVYTLVLAFAVGYAVDSADSEEMKMMTWAAPLLLILGLLPYGFCSVQFGDQLTFSYKKLVILYRKTAHKKEYVELREKRNDVQNTVREFSRRYLNEGGTFKERASVPTVGGKALVGRSDYRFSITPKDNNTAAIEELRAKQRQSECMDEIAEGESEEEESERVPA